MDSIRLGQRSVVRFREHKINTWIAKKVDNSTTSLGKKVLMKDYLSKNLSSMLIAVLPSLCVISNFEFHGVVFSHIFKSVVISADYLQSILFVCM